MMTRKKLQNCLFQAVELTDCDGITKKGWLIPVYHYKDYCLLPFDDIWHTYIYKVSHIKKIKFLTNGYEIK